MDCHKAHIRPEDKRPGYYPVRKFPEVEKYLTAKDEFEDLANQLEELDLL